MDNRLSKTVSEMDMLNLGLITSSPSDINNLNIYSIQQGVSAYKFGNFIETLSTVKEVREKYNVPSSKIKNIE